MNITSASLRAIKSDAFSLIADIRSTQKKFDSLISRAEVVGLNTKRTEGQSDISLIGGIAAHAADEEITILRKESLAEVNDRLSSKEPKTNKPTTKVGRFFNKIAVIVG